MGFMYHKGDPITRPIGKWARDHVSLKRAQQVFQESHPSALVAGLQINWASMHTIAKNQGHAWQRVRYSKLVWWLFAFQHLKMLRGHCKPSDVNCAFCGSELETQERVFSR